MKYYNDDIEFVKKCCSGCSAAWEQFNGKYKNDIKVSICSYLSKCSLKRYSEDYINDLVQIVMVKLIQNNYEKLKKYNGTSSLTTWISTVSVNTAIDEYRKNKINIENHATSLQDEMEDDNGNVTTKEIADKTQKDPIEIAINEEIGLQIAKGIESLTFYEKVLFKLRYKLELSQKHISRILKRKQGTIGSDIARVTNKIRRYLEKHYK